MLVPVGNQLKIVNSSKIAIFIFGTMHIKHYIFLICIYKEVVMLVGAQHYPIPVN